MTTDALVAEVARLKAALAEEAMARGLAHHNDGEIIARLKAELAAAATKAADEHGWAIAAEQAQDKTEAERDAARGEVERLREALVSSARDHHTLTGHAYPFEECRRQACQAARAALQPAPVQSSMPPVGRAPEQPPRDGTRLTRSGYTLLIAGDLAWLDAQPRTLERDHVAMVLKDSITYYYGQPAPVQAAAPLCADCGHDAGWHQEVGVSAAAELLGCRYRTDPSVAPRRYRVRCGCSKFTTPDPQAAEPKGTP